MQKNYFFFIFSLFQPIYIPRHLNIFIRAQMRVIIKRLLKKYNYPPEGQEQAPEVVMEQCNQWADQEYHDAITESGGKPIL